MTDAQLPAVSPVADTPPPPAPAAAPPVKDPQAKAAPQAKVTPPPPPPADPAPPVEAEPEVEEAESALDFDVVSPVRKPKVVKVELDGIEGVVFVKEWTTRVLFSMIKNVQSVMDSLTRSGVLAFKPSDTALTGEEQQAERNSAFMSGVLAAVADGEEKLEAVMTASVFTDRDCKKAIDTEWLGDLVISDTVMLVKAIWFVNWEAGSLKKVVTAPSTDSKRVKPKKH